MYRASIGNKIFMHSIEPLVMLHGRSLTRRFSFGSTVHGYRALLREYQFS